MRIKFILMSLLVAAIAFCSILQPTVEGQLAGLIACFTVAATAVIQIINQ